MESNRPLLLLQNEPLLTKAVLKKSLHLVKERILEGDDPHYRDVHKRTYLHLSAFLNSLELLEYFIEEGVEVDECDSEGLTPLHRACRNGCPEVVSFLLEHGANPSATALYNVTPLHICAYYGHVKCAQLIIEKLGKSSEYIEPLDVDYNTPLHYAAYENHYKVVMALIEAGASPNIYNISGNTPLHFASAIDDVYAVTSLATANTINARNSFGQTALHMTARSGGPYYYGTATHLLNQGADPNIKDSEGNTCLHLALKRGIVELFKVLMNDPRTDPSIPDNEMNTVIHTAIKLGHTNLISQMLPSAKDLTVQDSEGCSILIRAIQHNLEELASNMLKACPALATCINHELVTPLHLAAERGMKQLTHELLIAGAPVNALDANGLTPSLYCAKNDEVLECLSMIEDMMINDGTDDSRQRRSSSLKYEPKISS